MPPSSMYMVFMACLLGFDTELPVLALNLTHVYKVGGSFSLLNPRSSGCRYQGVQRQKGV